MTPDKLRELLYQEPFRPFRVRVNDGRSFDIRHPKLNLVGESVFIIGIPERGDPDPGFSDHTEWVPIKMIDGVELLSDAVASAAG